MKPGPAISVPATAGSRSRCSTIFPASARGFVDAEIHRLADARGFTPPPALAADAPNAAELERLLGLLRPAPDYALVARKA